MNVKVKFLGGAGGTVTGSKFLLELDNFRILVDCGLFQGLKELRQLNWAPFPVSPKSIDCVLLTHAHIDHSGYLPRLVREGFHGPVYCTEATAELTRILLLDSAKLQEEEAAYAQKKGYSKHEKPEPLYRVEEVENTLPLLQPYPYQQTVEIGPGAKITFYQAGHILGAASIKIVIQGQQQEKKIVFSGDLGRFHDPVLYPPSHGAFADILFLEATYGHRRAPETGPEETLAAAIRSTCRAGGVAILPSFAVGRTQLLLYYLFRLQQQGRIPDIPIYVDSPMAIDVTRLYKSFGELHRIGAMLEEDSCNPFRHKRLHYVSSQEGSIGLNQLRGDAIIVSASGMASGGRVLHHLYHRLPRPQDAVIFVGHQAQGTRGRRLVEGEESVRMYGIDVPVRAKIYQIAGLSAHADQQELLQWAAGFVSKPKRCFLIHGEQEALETLGAQLETELGWQVQLPAYLESVALFEGL